MAEFNLIDEEWIPCITLKGTIKEFGIRDTLLKAHELREICDDSPLVTVAIHRLLLAILYRAYSGPSDFNRWKGLYTRGKFDPKTVTVYLEQWKSRFYLLDDEHPFYQMGGLETNNSVSVNRLATECASGNNATLFDHCSDDEKVSWSFAKVARQLLACQSFASGGGNSGNVTIKGKNETLPNLSDAIALRGMTVWIQGQTLFSTLMINNKVPSVDESIPPWELENTHKYRDIGRGKDKKINNRSNGIVDRFTWQSRLIRLIPDGTSVSRMYSTQGRSADKSAGDPMKAYRISKEEGISAVPLNSNKAAWRDAHAILTIPPAGNREQRPECFNVLAKASMNGVISNNEHFLAQVVGLASAPNKAAKFLLWRHERLPVPIGILGSVDLTERFAVLISEAEAVGSELSRGLFWSATSKKTIRTEPVGRIQMIADFVLAPLLELRGNGIVRTADGRFPDDAHNAACLSLSDNLDPRPAYWARLEKHFFDLLENLPSDWDRSADGWNPDDQQTATRTWRDAIKQEAKRALEESIRCLGTTARAISAVARVRTDFSDNDLRPQPPKAKTSKRKSKAVSKGGKKI